MEVYAGGLKHHGNYKCPSFFSLFPREADVHVSATLESAGHWELRLTHILQYTLRSLPNAGFINLGANIGYYTLLAASMGHQVIAGKGPFINCDMGLGWKFNRPSCRNPRRKEPFKEEPPGRDPANIFKSNCLPP